jgi:N-acetylmuramoyl-L-alanine amidase
MTASRSSPSFHLHGQIHAQNSSADSLSVSPTNDRHIVGTPENPDALQALLAFSSLHERIRERARHGVALDPPFSEQATDFALQEVLQLVAERAVAITGASGAALAIAEEGAIVCRGRAGEIAPDLGARLNPSAGFTGICYRTGEIIRCDDSEDDPRVDRDACRRLGTRSMVAVPLRSAGVVHGVLAAFSPEPYGFDDADVRSLNLLSELVLAALRPGPPQDPGFVESPPAMPLAIDSPVRIDLSRTERTPAIFSEYQEPPQPSHVWRWIAVGLVASAILAAAGWWWNRERTSAQAATKPVVQAQPASAPAPTPVLDSAPPLSSATTSSTALLPKVTGIRHWSNADASTVVIDLEDQAPYEAHRLTSPDRIYFDLHDTVLAPDLIGKTIEVGDPLLSRIRVAQPMTGVTRVVLETNGSSNFSVSLEPSPYRLVVEVRKIQVPAVEPKGATDPGATGTGAIPNSALARPSAEDLQLRAHVPGMRIVVDAGHGGWDLGTAGQKGVLEKDLVLEIAQRLENLLRQRLGAEVILTRQDDNYVPLEKRAAIANQAQADMFVSVHANYSSLPSARGIETYYTTTAPTTEVLEGEQREMGQPANARLLDAQSLQERSSQSRQLAMAVQQSLYSTLAPTSPGLRNRGVKAAPFIVLTGTSMPAVLAEVSFVSSPEDEHNLLSPQYRQKIAEALYRGISRYLSDTNKIKVASAAGHAGGR